MFSWKMEGLRGSKKLCLGKVQGQWILLLDADEVVSKKLRARIEEIVNTKQAKELCVRDKTEKHCLWEGNKARRMGRLRDKAVEKWGCENQ